MFFSGKLQQHEVLGLANIFNNLTCQNKLITWAKEQEKKDVFLSFLQLATQFICMFITEAVNQENVSRKFSFVNTILIFDSLHSVFMENAFVKSHLYNFVGLIN